MFKTSHKNDSCMSVSLSPERKEHFYRTSIEKALIHDRVRISLHEIMNKNKSQFLEK